MGFSVSYTYQIIDRYTAPLKKITRLTDNFSAKTKKASKGLQNFSGRMTSAQGAITAFAGVLGGANILNTFVNFDKAMNKLGSVTLANDEVMSRFRKTAKDLGETTQFSASQAAQGMTFLAMAGLDTDQVLAAIPDTLKLAAAGGLELSQAADIATNVMAQMGFEAKDLGRINDVLALSQSKANLNIVEMFEAMRPTAVTAKNLGMTLEQTASVLGVMANAGEKGSIAGTLFRNMLINLAGPSKTQQKIYKALGINLSEFTGEAGKLKNFTGFIGKLQELDKQGKATVPVLQALFGDRGFRAAQILIGAGGEELAKFNTMLNGATGTVDKASAVMMRGFPGVILAMSSAFEAFKIGLIESGIDKILIDLFKNLTSILRTMAAANPTLLKTIGIIGGIAIALAPVIMGIGIMSGGLSVVAGAIAALATPAVAAFAAIGAVIAIAWAKSEKFRQGITRLALAFKPLIDLLMKAVGYVGELFSDLILSKVEQFGDMVGGIADFIAGGIEAGVGGIMDIFGSKPATEAASMQGTLNGRIEVSASQGSRVRRASLTTDMPGNMGLTLAAQ